MPATNLSMLRTMHFWWSSCASIRTLRPGGGPLPKHVQPRNTTSRLGTCTQSPVDNRLKSKLARGVSDELAYRSGESSTKLARRFGIGKSSVLCILRQQGVEIRHQSMTPSEIEDAIKLYEAGDSLLTVGQSFGRRASAIQDLLIRAGVARRTTSGKPG